MEEELLLLLLAAQEGIALVQLPGPDTMQTQFKQSRGIIDTEVVVFQPVCFMKGHMVIYRASGELQSHNTTNIRKCRKH